MEKTTKSTLRMIMSLIQHALSVDNDLYKTAGVISDLMAEGKGKERLSEAVRNLAEIADSPLTTALCHIALTLIDNGQDENMPYLSPTALNVISNLMEEKFQEVGTNQGKQVRRFYTENQADQNWRQVHHLIDIDLSAGTNYGECIIREFEQGEKADSRVRLEYNEVKELLAMALRVRVAKAEQDWKEAEARNAGKPYHGDDFDPFLDADDLP